LSGSQATEQLIQKEQEGERGQRDKGKRREHSGKLSSHRGGIRTKPRV